MLSVWILFINPTIELRKDLPPPKYKVLGWTATKEEVKLAVIDEFGKDFAKIVECESGFNLKAKNINKNKSVDSGLFQINSVHNKNAQKLGIDLSTIQGQFEYARYLIDKNGYRDWVCKKVL